MAITNPDFIYVAKYDIYVSRSKRAFYKRCSRRRKTEITDDELVLMENFKFSPTEYIQLNSFSIGGKQCTDCISYVFAEAFPELVGNADLHAKYPHLYTELNHKNHVHNTWESNYPENLEYLPVSINRADISTNVEKNNPDEKRLRKSRYHKDWYQQKKQDPDWLAKSRKRDAARKLKKYHETKSIRKQQAEQLAAQLQTLAGLRKQQADDKHQLADN